MRLTKSWVRPQKNDKTWYKTLWNQGPLKNKPRGWGKRKKMHATKDQNLQKIKAHCKINVCILLPNSRTLKRFKDILCFFGGENCAVQLHAQAFAIRTMPGKVWYNRFCNEGTPSWRSGPWTVLPKSGGATYSLNCKGYNSIAVWDWNDVTDIAVDDVMQVVVSGWLNMMWHVKICEVAWGWCHLWCHVI